MESPPSGFSRISWSSGIRFRSMSRSGSAARRASAGGGRSRRGGRPRQGCSPAVPRRRPRWPARGSRGRRASGDPFRAVEARPGLVLRCAIDGVFRERLSGRSVRSGPLRASPWNPSPRRAPGETRGSRGIRRRKPPRAYNDAPRELGSGLDFLLQPGRDPAGRQPMQRRIIDVDERLPPVIPCRSPSSTCSRCSARRCSCRSSSRSTRRPGSY